MTMISLEMPPLERARHSLQGLAIGDAVGKAIANIGRFPTEFHPAPWSYTDDTEMAIALVQHLEARGAIDQDSLASSFADRFAACPDRGYGPVAHWILTRISEGHPWRKIAATPYDGTGSLGNGAAMRVAPLGAYFAEEMDTLVESARLSAQVTHLHPQGQAGAVAIAIAASLVLHRPEAALDDLQEVASRAQDDELEAALKLAATLDGVSPQEAGERLGTGRQVRALDSVPYALWCAFSHLANFEEAISTAIEGFADFDADADTICAMIGGIVSLTCSPDTIPPQWISQSESLPC